MLAKMLSRPNNMGSRVHDMQLKHIADIIHSVNAGANSSKPLTRGMSTSGVFWNNFGLADGRKLIPGVITNSTVLVGHEEVVADRLGRFAEVVGSENLVAGADCDFSSFAGSDEFSLQLYDQKLKSLFAGARLALQSS